MPVGLSEGQGWNRQGLGRQQRTSSARLLRGRCADREREALAVPRPVRSAFCAGMLGAGMMFGACSSSKQTSASIPPSAQKLWGDLQPVVSIKELMNDMIDPA